MDGVLRACRANPGPGLPASRDVGKKCLLLGLWVFVIAALSGISPLPQENCLSLQPLTCLAISLCHPSSIVHGLQRSLRWSAQHMACCQCSHKTGPDPPGPGINWVLRSLHAPHWFIFSFSSENLSPWIGWQVHVTQEKPFSVTIINLKQSQCQTTVHLRLGTEDPALWTCCLGDEGQPRREARGLRSTIQISALRRATRVIFKRLQGETQKN